MIKDVNIFEQHVEKIVLAVAAAGALYMGYLAIQPLTIGQDNTPISEVENKLAEQIRQMNETMTINGGKKVEAPEVNFLAEYRRRIQQQPLRNELVNAPIPAFAPAQLALNDVGTTSNPTNSESGPLKVVTPAPVAPDPRFLDAKAWQQPVAVYDIPTQPGQPIQLPPPPAAGQLLPSRDVNAVVITGQIPVAKMLIDLAKQPGQPEKLALQKSQLNRVTIYRIEVRRRERGTGGWSDWKMVPPTNATYPKPIDVNFTDWVGASTQTLMQQVDSQFKQIVIPDFYIGPTGQPTLPPNLLPQKTPDKSLTDAMNALSADLQKATNTAAAPGAAPRFGAAPVVAPPPQIVANDLGQMNLDATSTDTGDTSVPQFPSVDTQGLRSQPMWPFCFWDETVEPDHQYQYQVRVVYINPMFNWPAGLKDPAMKNKPTLVSDWVPQVPKVVTVNPDLRFFVTNWNQNKDRPTVSVRVYKRTFGKWYWSEFTSPMGGTINGQIALVDQKPITQMAVETGYTVVDVVPRGGSEAQVVLMDPAGKLSTRETGADRNDPENRVLYGQSQQRETPATKPAPVRGRGARGVPSPDQMNDLTQ